MAAPNFIETTDSSDQPYVEFDLSNGERMRLTRRFASWAQGDVMRIQIREVSGHLRPGPELPVAQVADFLFAVGRLCLRPGE
ncbi:hypothetical protein [Nannocystis pusilla]|jgi:hypothetical protein|uniref:hypothetical protein n=1 Tax=Nannocystis pusilla TaxID=889268 RepID=UPI003DA4B361